MSAVRAIREYYTRDQAQECVDTWNALNTVEQSQHILSCSPFRAMVIIAQETLRKDAELGAYMNSAQWSNMLQQHLQENTNGNKSSKISKQASQKESKA